MQKELFFENFSTVHSTFAQTAISTGYNDFVPFCFAGMGFVKFQSKESADKCLQEAENSGIVLDGRQLIISLAVSREQSSKFNEKKTKEKKDNRNLYLAREGSELIFHL